MNKLSNEKRTSFQVRLTSISQKILESFSQKYGTSKSIVIERALELLAAQYHRKIYLEYKFADDPGETTTTTTKKNDIYSKTKEKHIERINKIYSEKPNLDPVSDEEMDAILKEIDEMKTSKKIIG